LASGANRLSQVFGEEAAAIGVGIGLDTAAPISPGLAARIRI